MPQHPDPQYPYPRDLQRLIDQGARIQRELDRERSRQQVEDRQIEEARRRFPTLPDAGDPRPDYAT